MFAPFDQQIEDIIHVRNTTQQEESMHRPDRIRVVRIALRLSLAAAFLSAVADRFGWWAPFGQGSWGSMGAFADYTHQLVPFASGWLLTVIVWTATATEATLGVLLLTGWRPKLVGAATCLVLIVFGTAMAVSLGMASPLSYSVFSAASAAAAYAILGTTSAPHTALYHRGTHRSGLPEVRRANFKRLIRAAATRSRGENPPDTVNESTSA
jgi:uncharacterized membrane protein YphA (DoxX/SURF4 family)